LSRLPFWPGREDRRSGADVQWYDLDHLRFLGAADVVGRDPTLLELAIDGVLSKGVVWDFHPGL